MNNTLLQYDGLQTQINELQVQQKELVESELLERFVRRKGWGDEGVVEEVSHNDFEVRVTVRWDDCYSTSFGVRDFYEECEVLGE